MSEYLRPLVYQAYSARTWAVAWAGVYFDDDAVWCRNAALIGPV